METQSNSSAKTRNIRSNVKPVPEKVETQKVETQKVETQKVETQKVETQKVETQKTTVVKKKKTRFFETYISKVLKNVSESNGITSNAKQQLNSVLCIIARIVATCVVNITEISKKKTLSENEVVSALRVIFRDTDLCRTLVQHSSEAVDSFKTGTAVKGTSRQSKAGITFPPCIAEKFLRNFGYSKVMVTANAPVCFAAALEYLAVVILGKASTLANDGKHKRVNIRDLELSVRNDTNLNHFFTEHHISFLGGGVVPYVHSSLLPKKNRKKRVTKASATPSDAPKKHRFRPGTVALREIRKYQKMSNVLTLAKHPFERYIRELVTRLHDGANMKISKDVFTVLQYFVEQELVRILRMSNSAAIHAGRVKLMSADISFVTKLLSGENPDSTTVSATASTTKEEVALENVDEDEEEEEEEEEEEVDEEEEEEDEEALNVN